MSKPAMDVLVIDDEPDILEVVRMYLENMGCFRNIVTSEDGQLGVKKLLNQKFEIIIVDINLPKRDGIEILGEFKKGFETQNSIDNVIVISGELDKTKLEKAVANGAKHFLIKPFNEKSFQEKVLSVVSQNKDLKK